MESKYLPQKNLSLFESDVKNPKKIFCGIDKNILDKILGKYCIKNNLKNNGQALILN